MAKNIDSQKIMLAHSKAKVELYSKYLEKYLAIISRDGYTKKINIYDLFCGEGIYENGGQGSPLTVIDVLDESKVYEKIAIKLLFNDIEQTKIDKLKTIVAESGNKSYEIVYQTSDYETVLEQTKAEIKRYGKEKGILFIDPYGYKKIKIQDIKDLLETKKTELLLFLPISFMYRFIKKAKMTEEEKPYIEPLKRLLKSIYGENIPIFPNAIKFIDSLKEEFKKFLKTFYVDTFILERDEKKTYFSLFFFSSHIRGFEKMLETKWELDTKRGAGFRFQPEPSLNMFTVVEQNAYSQLLQEFLLKGKKYNADLYKFGLEQGYLPTHTNDILRSWQKLGQVQVLRDDKKSVKANSFYINYECYKDEPKKVYFKMTQKTL